MPGNSHGPRTEGVEENKEKWNVDQNIDWSEFRTRLEWHLDPWNAVLDNVDDATHVTGNAYTELIEMMVAAGEETIGKNQWKNGVSKINRRLRKETRKNRQEQTKCSPPMANLLGKGNKGK